MGFNDGGAFLPLPVLLAVAGYAYSTWNQIASEHRHGQLERVNEQVGALHSCPCVRVWARVTDTLGFISTTSSPYPGDVTWQVKELYGPLLMCITATQSAWMAMVSQHSPDGTPESFQAAVRRDPQGVQAKAYRDWVREVFMPLNSKAADVLMERVDLLEAQAVDPSLQKLVAHVSVLKVIIKQWAQGDLAAASVVSYPEDLLQKIQQEYLQVKRRQAYLLGIAPTRLHPRPRL